MGKVVCSAAAKPLDPTKVVFFATRPVQDADGSWFEDVTARIARLEIEATESDPETPHFLVRKDDKGKLVWRTQHASRQEAIWQAEWEYEIKAEAWTKAE
ncbi:MAG: hypothetical protein AMXMBFR7_18490 [Planctomycetota bacterium]